ncbi:MAG TPA: hypothetical protein PKI94_02025 [Candidatus Gastranaerophilaceae bacterium]|nr:hypothetical protein [Candidatus Gastranaerophilaceae bacterium]
MRKLIWLFSALLLVFLTTQTCFAQDKKILILPDNIQFESTNYYIYPDTSVIFASDTINSLRLSGKVDTVSMAEIRDAFRKNVRLNITTRRALKEYKYNYNIAFVDIKPIAHTFDTNKVLLITSTTDTQSYLLRRTVWDFLNIPGAAVIDPAYRVSTYIALVDVDEEKVLWQGTFQKNLSAVENRMIGVNFAPATKQLEKLKFYSSYFTPMIAQIVENKLCPSNIPVKSVESKIIDENNLAPESVKIEEIDIGNKPFAPTKPRDKKSNFMINDL